MSKICGIYAISDVDTGNVYVGSSNSVGKRWSFHLAKLRGNSHKYFELQEAWNNNENRIKFEVLEQCPETISEEELTQLEQDYIDYFKLIDGINIINKVQDKVIRTKGKVKDTSNMSKAQQGMNNGHARLTANDIIEIKKLLEEGTLTQNQIAEQFGVSPSHVSNIKYRKKWLCI